MANISPSLADLLDEFLADIIIHVARSSAKDGASLDKVNKAFRRHWNTEGVRRECPLAPLNFFPAIEDSAEITSLVVAMTQLCQAGNPDALYREGITSLFDSRRRERADEGLTQLKAAADKGHIEARYIYGLILISSGVERKDECYNILATLMQPTSLRGFIVRMEQLSDDLTQKYLAMLQGGVSKAADIIGQYHLGWSHCHGEDLFEDQDYLDSVEMWGSEAVEYDPLNDLMCQKCFWRREVIYFLDWLGPFNN